MILLYMQKGENEREMGPLFYARYPYHLPRQDSDHESVSQKNTADGNKKRV